MEPTTQRVILILADISGYTQFMLANQIAAVHGQMFITQIIESIIREIDIPLRLQEIEGDAVFLYAVHPGNEGEWQAVRTQVGKKLLRFFDAFAETVMPAAESGLCNCPACTNVTELKLKVVAHSGEAVFHSIAQRAQVSGVDVILVHRLLKNSVTNREYLLLTEPAYRDLHESIGGEFIEGQESYDGFPMIKTFVRFIGEGREHWREKVYALPAHRLAWYGVRHAVRAVIEQFPALLVQIRRPVANVGPIRRAAFVLALILVAPLNLVHGAVATPLKFLHRRAHRS